MIYSNVSSDQNVIEVYTIRSLSDIRWMGDNKAEEFWSRFNTIRSSINIPLDDGHIRDILYTEMKKSIGLTLYLLDYKKTPEQDRTLAELTKISIHSALDTGCVGGTCTDGVCSSRLGLAVCLPLWPISWF